MTDYFAASGWGAAGFFSFYVTARMVQRQYQFAAVEYGMLEVLVERNGIMRAGIDAKLAEYARTEVVFILRQYLLFSCRLPFLSSGSSP